MKRHFVVDAETGRVERHASTLQGYGEADYRALLRRAGFAGVESVPSLIGRADPETPELTVLRARVS